MMFSFSSDVDDPDAVLHAIRTLMVYNEEAWFFNLKKKYALRYDDHMLIQLVIAEGLFRFGRYEEAETYCRKAIVLGGRKRGEELLGLCQAMRDQAPPSAVEPESMLRPYAFLISLALVCITMVAVTGFFAMRKSAVWVVSGSPVPYTVFIDGDPCPLESYGRKRIVLSLGKHEMHVQDMGGYEAPFSFSYGSSMLQQKIRKQTFVLNPDGMAVLIEETPAGAVSGQRFFFGETLYQFDAIDDAFASFPLRSGAKNSSPTRLYNHTASNVTEMVAFLRQHGPPGAAAEYARRVLRVVPSCEDAAHLLAVASSDLTTDQAVAFLRFGTSLRPPLPAWHLHYQSLMLERKPEYDLQTEYGLLCREHPEESLYYYLLACVARTPDMAKKFYLRSEQGAGCQGRGYCALARTFWYEGRYREAEAYISKAAEKMPENPELRSLRKQINLALQQYEVPLQMVEAEILANPSNKDLYAEKIKYLTLMGNHSAVAETVDLCPIRDVLMDSYLQAARFYVSGNVKGYLDLISRSGHCREALQKDLYAGKIDDAHQILSADENHRYIDHLLLYTAALYLHRPDVAGLEWAKALDEINDSTLGGRKEILLLSSDQPPDPEEIRSLEIMPDDKRILCTALGFKHASLRQMYFNLAQEYNYSPEYPQVLLKKWMRNTARQE